MKPSTRHALVATLLFTSCGGQSATRPTAVASPAPREIPALKPPAVMPANIMAPEAAPPPAPSPLVATYRETAQRIFAAARSDQDAWKKLEYLTDRIGPRLSGSVALDRAIAWAMATMAADGHEVRKEKVMVPNWVRGEESAEIVLPIQRGLRVLGLGGTVGTAKKGIVAEIVVVSTFEELEALGDKARGRIVLYNNPMPTYGPSGSGYGDRVAFRLEGASRAAKQGAVAALVRSLTARSLRTPHTGVVLYDEGIAKIPAAAVTTEDADHIARLSKSGEPVTIRLFLGAKALPDAESANVIGELRGGEKPEEVVVISAHLDSWDVGQGAHDDGAGCAAVMQSLTLLRKLGLTPRRTIRAVLFTNEENGLRGSKAYAEAHQEELPRHVAAIELDSGGFKPEGWDVMMGPEALALVKEIGQLLAPVGAGRVDPGFPGTDIKRLAAKGVPLLGLSTEGSTYFDYHHTEADTLEKVNPEHLKLNVAALAAMAYVLADMPQHLPGTPLASP